MSTDDIVSYSEDVMDHQMKEYDMGKNALISRTEAAELAGRSPRTISRWTQRGVLTAYRNASGEIRYSAKEVARAVEFLRGPAQDGASATT